MTHLRIEQSGITEEVSSFVISKLYEIAHAGLDVSSNLQGRLHVHATYQEYITELHTAYPELYISCDVYYLYLGDPTFTSIMAQKFGDGTGCTLADMDMGRRQLDQVWPSGITGNTNIIDATGFKYLTNLDWYRSNMQYIGGFRGCTSLQRCELPEGLIYLNAGQFASTFGFFRDCSSLTHIVLPSTLTQIAQYSFNGCLSLSSITIPSGVTEIGSNAFANTSSLAQIILPSALQTIGYNAFFNSGLTSIHIPNSVTSMGGVMFGSCPITSITFDQTSGSNLSWSSGQTYGEGCVASIDATNTTLTKLDFPERLTSMGQHPFRGLTNLTRMIFRNTTPISISNMDVPSGCKIYVPDAAVSDYKATSGWSSYADRIFGISQYATDFPND